MINKSKLEKIIPDVLEKMKCIYEKKPMKSEQKSYINSFGPTVVKSGLLITLIQYENENSDTWEKGKKDFILLLKEALSGLNEAKYSFVNKDTSKEISLLLPLLKKAKENKELKNQEINRFIDKEYKEDIMLCYLAIKNLTKVFKTNDSKIGSDSDV
jgi:hypothetical protein